MLQTAREATERLCDSRAVITRERIGASLLEEKAARRKAHAQIELRAVAGVEPRRLYEIKGAVTLNVYQRLLYYDHSRAVQRAVAHTLPAPRQLRAKQSSCFAGAICKTNPPKVEKKTKRDCDLAED